MAGYSGTPLAKKLGIKEGMRLSVLNAPDGYASWLKDRPRTAQIESTLVRPAAAVHLFVKARRELERALPRLRLALAPAGFVWVSWPKKASGVETDVTEDVVRAVALPIGFVDVKVCAVNDVWSGLKLVIRRRERARA
jgi:hypothetical protein